MPRRGWDQPWSVSSGLSRFKERDEHSMSRNGGLRNEKPAQSSALRKRGHERREVARRKERLRHFPPFCRRRRSVAALVPRYATDQHFFFSDQGISTKQTNFFPPRNPRCSRPLAFSFASSSSTLIHDKVHQSHEEGSHLSGLSSWPVRWIYCQEIQFALHNSEVYL